MVGFGQSMTPILKSGQPVICKPVTEDTELKKNDIVLCKVKGNYYLHKISAIKNGVSYQISNNHGHINGTITRSNIFLYVDVLVDGEYIDEQRDITLAYRGSKNQRVIDIQKSLAQNKIVLYCN